MQMVKIQISDRDECSKGFAALIRRGRVDCYPDNTFIIPEPGLQLLQELGVSYVELDDRFISSPPMAWIGVGRDAVDRGIAGRLAAGG